MKILVVNDSAVFREIVMRAIRDAGFARHDFLEASSGPETLDLVAKESPGLVLCGWRMPGMNGIETLLALRERESTVPFCFVSPGSNSMMKTQAYDAGAFAFLTPPFTPEAFERVLGKVLQ